jgi:prolipoprotein diacylglyceryltransferase
MDIDLSGVGEQIGTGIYRSITFYEICFTLGLCFGIILYSFLLRKYLKTKNKLVIVLTGLLTSIILGCSVVVVANQFISNYTDQSFSFMSFVDRK